MLARISEAAAAYANAASQAGAPGLGARDAVSGGSFGAMVEDMLGQAVTQAKGAEQATAAALVGQADTTAVVMAVNNAETTLQMVVSIRDKVIEAYQDIIRMPI